jgi:hypothetical protein
MDNLIDREQAVATISNHHFDNDKNNFDLLIHNLCKEINQLPTFDTKGIEDVAKRTLFLDILNYINDKRIENKQVTVNEVIEYIAEKENIRYVLVN